MKYILTIIFFILYLYVAYRFIITYKTFKGKNFIIVNSFYKFSCKKYLKIFFTLEFLIFIASFILGIFLIFSYRNFPMYLYVIPFIFSTYNELIIITDEYISTIFKTISTSDIDCIRIENDPITSSHSKAQLILFIKNKNEKVKINIPNRNIETVKNSLREVGYEVHITTKIS